VAVIMAVGVTVMEAVVSAEAVTAGTMGAETSITTIPRPFIPATRLDGAPGRPYWFRRIQWELLLIVALATPAVIDAAVDAASAAAWLSGAPF
jgi:hypothetical protein